MASILSGFEYDIFISYRHKDNRSGGVTEFVERLKKELEATFKEDLSIYFDSNPQDGLHENHNVNKSLEGKLKALIFIPIISQTYCDTKSFAWQHEFCAFNKLAKEDHFGRDVKLGNGNVASRILPIKVHDLDAEDNALIENEIGGVLRPIEFIYKELGVNRPLKVTDLKADNQNHTDYANQLNKVANAIKEIIAALKNPSQTTIATNTISSGKPVTGGKSNAARKVLGGFVSFFILLVLAYFIFQKFYKPSATDGEPEKSIAVLPFVNLSDDKQQEYFSDGLSEELLNLLAKIPELKVIARTSSFSFKGKNEDMRTIGAKLGVAHILEGSVRKSGNMLRITAQLIKVTDGSHLWSETYDRTLDDIFKVQDEISAAVVAQLKLHLLSAEAPQAKATNPEAYNLWLEGKYFSDRRSKENYEKAIQKYNSALALDSTFAPAWASLASAYSSQAISAYIPVTNGYAKARAALDKALRMDPQLAYAYAVQGAIYMNYDWDWARADVSIKKAIDLDPKSATSLSIAGTLNCSLGRLDKSVSFFKQAVALDPLRATIYNNLVIAYYASGKLGDAEAAARKVLELNPAHAGTHYVLAVVQLAQSKPAAALETIMKEPDENWRVIGLPLVYYKLNQKTNSDAALKELIERIGDGAAYQICEAYAYRGEKDKAFEWMERAYQQRDGGLADMKNSQLLKSLHSDARWLPFLKKMKLDGASVSKL